jgi:CYTH domain-containing protein
MAAMMWMWHDRMVNVFHIYVNNIVTHIFQRFCCAHAEKGAEPDVLVAPKAWEYVAMGIEIERKFLTSADTWRDLAESVEYRQGYLLAAPERTVRIRTAGSRGYLTIKGGSVGASRAEYEYEIPFEDARELLDEMCLRPLIEKRRSRIPHAGLVWEVDEFFGENHGLVLAEVELESEDQPIDLPPWIGREVTGDPRYFNASLVSKPYSSWREEDSP